MRGHSIKGIPSSTRLKEQPRLPELRPLFQQPRGLRRGLTVKKAGDTPGK